MDNFIENEERIAFINKAYAFVKNSIYYDKTLTYLKNKLVRYENSETFLKQLINAFSSEQALNDYFQSKDNSLFSPQGESEILNNIKVRSFFKSIKEKDDKKRNNNKKVINNNLDYIKEFDYNFQYFIDMPIDGYILGMMWIMLVGYKIDSTMIQNCYGNRVKLDEDKKINWNQNEIFFPYFEKFESWQTMAYNKSKEVLFDKNNCLIFTFDISRYYYSIDFDRNVFLSKLNNYSKINNVDDSFFNCLIKYLNDFIFNVIEKYNLELKKIFFDSNIDSEKINNCLPIGFYPSNILANYYLSDFDQKILQELNPDFYGRYVDDIIIIQKVSPELMKNDFFHNENPKKIVLANAIKDGNKEKIITNLFSSFFDLKNKKDKQIFCIKKKYLWNTDFPLMINEDKTVVSFFDHEKPIDNIEEIIRQTFLNRKVFNYLTNSNEFEQSKLDVYSFDSDMKKFNQLSQIEVDKYKLSVEIAKIKSWICIFNTSVDRTIFTNLDKVINYLVLLNNISSFEKILFILTYSVDESNKLVQTFLDSRVKKIINLFDKLISESKDNKQKFSLLNTLYSIYVYMNNSIHSVFTNFFGKKARVLLEKLVKIIDQLVGNHYEKNIFDAQSQIIFENIVRLDDDSNGLKQDIKIFRTIYRQSKMFDKSSMNIYFPYFEIKYEDIDSKDCLLFSTKFDDCIRLIIFNSNYLAMKESSNQTIIPFYFNIFDYQLVTKIQKLIQTSFFSTHDDENIYLNGFSFCQDNINGNESINDIDQNEINILNKHSSIETYFILKQLFTSVKIGNSQYQDNKNKLLGQTLYYGPENIHYFCNDSNVKNIARKKLDLNKIEIGLASVSQGKYVNDFLSGNPNRSKERWNQITKIINMAVKNHIDILVLPELFLPIDWLSMVEKICKRNQISLVSGIEYIYFNKVIFNPTLVLLPYESDKYKYSFFTMQIKKHYSPKEIAIFTNKGIKYCCGTDSNLYNYKGFFFKVMCCYEVSDALERTIFNSYIDACFVVELNRDIKYFDNIVSSLSRDIHCFIIQENDSTYGDSRICCPKKEEEKDIIKIKGGENNFVIKGEIDVNGLRKFQELTILEQEADKNKKYKSTPPGFDKKGLEFRKTLN